MGSDPGNVSGQCIGGRIGPAPASRNSAYRPRACVTLCRFSPQRARLVARNIDARCLEFGDVETNLARARQKITVQQGIEQKLAKKIAATIKDAKLKVETQINGDKLRVTGKKRDDLQAVMALLKGGDFERPLQFDNFRD
jgi:uncharacterized protein YajQ (UPF0234 family)